MDPSTITIWHFPFMIMASLVLFFVIVRIVLGKLEFNIVILSLVMVGLGMLFGKYGTQTGLKWWIYYLVPMLLTVLLPPYVLKMDIKKRCCI